MNKYIEIVKKWLADSSAVTSEELKANSDMAYAAYAAAAVRAADAANEAANAAFAAYVDHESAHGAELAARAAARASYYAHQNDAERAKKWLNEYKEVTGR
jgi:hypothetical protein